MTARPAHKSNSEARKTLKSEPREAGFKFFFTYPYIVVMWDLLWALHV